MSFDRQYYVNTRDGFTALWKKSEVKDGRAIFKRNYTVKGGGEYYLQYYTEPFSTLEVISPSARYTPILHGEDKEYLISLNSGENEVVVSITCDGSEPIPYTRLINADGEIVRDDEYFSDRAYTAAGVLNSADAPQDFTAAVGKGFKSFGRFGFSKGDGVLDYSMPAFGIISRPFISGMPRYKKHAMWSFSILPDGEVETGINMKVYKTPKNEKIDVDWTHTTWHRDLSDGHFISYDYSTVSSSLLVETDLDYVSLSRMAAIGAYTSATFCVSDGDCESRFVTKTAQDGILYDIKRDGQLKKNFVLLSRQNTFPEVPLLLTLPRSPRTIKRDKNGVKLEFDGSVGFALLTFLYGIEVFDTEDLTHGWYEKAIEKAMTVHALSLARAVRCDEYFKIEGQCVRIINKYEFKTFTDSLDTPPLYASPLPPPVMLESLYGGAATADKGACDLGLPTKYGPLFAVLDKNVSEYTIPIPEYREKFNFTPKSKELFAEMLHSDFDDYISYHRDKGYIPNPGNYSFLFQYAYPSKLFAYLKKEDRARLEEIMREGIDVVSNPDYAYVGPSGRRCLCWYKRTEPYTDISYLSTYLHITGISKYSHCDREIIENSENVFIELDWGNGMSLYATWLAALFTGSLDKIEENFSIFRRAFDYYLVGMDFACMTVGYAENGVSWNDGTNYGGYLGFVNIADALGKKEELELGLYAYAKMCSLRRGMLLSAQHYFCKYFGTEPWYIAKFFHEETDGDCAFISYPKDLISNGYRRQGLYNFSTEGHYLEAFRMYAKYLPEELEKLLTAAEGSLIGSLTGKKIDLETEYSTLKNGFLGEQETFTYLALSTILDRFDYATLEKMINEAAENGRISRDILGNYVWSHRRLSREWSRIMLLTQLYSKDSVTLSAWRNLLINSASYPELSLSSVTENAWIELHSSSAPHATLNGKPLAFTHLRENIYRAEISEDGIITFE